MKQDLIIEELDKLENNLIEQERELRGGFDPKKTLSLKGVALIQNSDLLAEMEYLTEIIKSKRLSDYDRIMDSLYRMVKIGKIAEETGDKLEYLKFTEDGKKFDVDKLKIMFKARELNKKFPKLNLNRYVELINDPVLELENFEGKKIKYDSFVVSRIIIAINQLIFDEMDIRIVNVGKEGSGKSCLASQYIFYIWWFMTEVGLISYEYDVTKLFYSSVERLLDEQDKQKDDDYCRIFCLDEGYELNKQNFREEASRLYKDSMRSDRKMLRIEFINLPQIGELESAITQTRTNFIFEAVLSNSLKTGTLKKGNVKLYIVPRGDSIYSRYLRKEIPSKKIVNELNRVLKDKNDSYKGLPESILIHCFEFKGIWGFDKSIYDKFIKKENKARRSKKGFIVPSDYFWYIFHTRSPDLKYWKFKEGKADKAMYKTAQSVKYKARAYFDNNPEIYMSFRNMEDLKNEFSESKEFD